MHYLPSDEPPRQKWIRFVRIHRKDFASTKSSMIVILCLIVVEKQIIPSGISLMKLMKLIERIKNEGNRPTQPYPRVTATYLEFASKEYIFMF